MFNSWGAEVVVPAYYLHILCWVCWRMVEVTQCQLQQETRGSVYSVGSVDTNLPLPVSPHFSSHHLNFTSSNTSSPTLLLSEVFQVINVFLESCHDPGHYLEPYFIYRKNLLKNDLTFPHGQ